MLVKVETYFDGEFWCARGIGVDIFTQGQSLDELYDNIKEAVFTHYGNIEGHLTVLTISEMELSDAKLPQVSGDNLIYVTLNLVQGLNPSCHPENPLSCHPELGSVSHFSKHEILKRP